MTLSNTKTRAATTFCLVLALTFIQSVTGTVPFMQGHAVCYPACADFRKVVGACKVNRERRTHIGDWDTYVRCADPCMELSEPCMALCSAEGPSIVESCKEECKDQAIDCNRSCFRSRFTEKKSSVS